MYGTSSGHSADPTWECFIDNVSIGRTDPFQFAENNWLFCSSEILADTSHLLTVNANSRGHTFWFDYIRYTPSANAFLGDALVYIDSTDPAIRYDSDWRPLGNVANMTSSTGSTVAFDFLGELRFSLHDFTVRLITKNSRSDRCKPRMVQSRTNGTVSRPVIGDIFYRWRGVRRCRTTGARLFLQRIRIQSIDLSNSHLNIRSSFNRRHVSKQQQFHSFDSELPVSSKQNPNIRNRSLGNFSDPDRVPFLVQYYRSGKTAQCWKYCRRRARRATIFTQYRRCILLFHTV